ncbi:MAG: hypothetical protein LBR08_02935 [Bacteroidales bacterium]|jgi:hypothetical protein|nr:hypothetical protein [Bacteroidales bacterium]
MEMPARYEELKYDLLAVAFDPQTGVLGDKTDTVLAAARTGKSASLPRMSPDGKYIALCLSASGTFPVWHRDNDIYLLDMSDGSLLPAEEINSDESDSYHSWSSCGRWMVFGSRRADGLYTRPYIARFDGRGKFAKPFLLPQKDPMFYQGMFKSYNIPELITGKIATGIHTFERVAKGRATGVRPP